MKLLIFGLIFGIWQSLAHAVEIESLSFSRKISVQVCDENQKCELKETQENRNIVLQAFKKGNTSGHHAEDRGVFAVDNIPFRSELFLNKVRKGYFLYIVLRSGKGTARNGSTKKIAIRDLNTFAPVSLKEKLFEKGNKKYLAEITLAPLAL